jgi:hypothetical protein
MSEQYFNRVIDTEDPAYIEERNNRKLTADKIRQILSKVLNNPGDSAKRWIWELMQNAKDVPNKAFGRVSIQVFLHEDKLVFKHNGDPFSLQNIFSLIQQVSSKNSANLDEEVTGKFGTGFICTHLLSEVIEVEGYVLHRGLHRKFKTVLDRSGNTSEELLPKIDAALEHIRNISDDSIFPIRKNYEETRTENSFDTVFTYFISSPEKKKAAIEGISDLINTLPATLVNLPKIKKVDIENLIENYTETYESLCLEEDFTSQVNKFEVSISSSARPHVKRHYYVYKNDDVALTAEVDNFHLNSLVKISDAAPILFRDFPLIGSNKFFFPFLLNGFKFNPTEDRDSILLHSKESNDAILNRSIVENAFAAAEKFVTFLLHQNVKNRYVLAKSRMPEEKWEDYSKEWFITLQKKYRKFLWVQALVETNDDGKIEPLQTCWIPKYGQNERATMSFYYLCEALLGADRVPRADLALLWILFTGPSKEIERWPHQIFYKIEDLIQNIEDQMVSTTVGESIKSRLTIPWLNSLYSFLIEENETELFSKHAIIPNQNDKFCRLGDLTLEHKEENVPNEFLDILKIIGEDRRETLIHRDVLLPKQNIEKTSLGDISREINDIINKDEKNQFGQYENQFIKRPDAFTILKDIIRNIGSETNRNSTQCKLFYCGKKLFHFEEDLREVTNVKQFNFTPSLRLFVKLINKKIEHIGSLEELQKTLGLKSESETTLWLDNYLHILSNKEDLKSLLDYGNIVPNRYGSFRALSSLKAYGTTETPLNNTLLNILLSLDDREDWKKDLIHQDITIPTKEAILFEQLGVKVQEVVNEIKRSALDDENEDDVYEKHRDALLDLIDWCRKNDELSNKYLSIIKSRSSEMYFKLNSKLNIDDLKLLNNEENRDLLHKIVALPISSEEINKLLSITASLGSASQLIAHGEALLEEEINFQFLLSIGKKVELFLKEAIEKVLPGMVVQHVGTGPHDFKIINPLNGSVYLIELKSYAANSTSAFRFAYSQASKASHNVNNYALCFIPRAGVDMDFDYISLHLKFRKNIGSIFQQGLSDYTTFKNLLSRKGTSSWLHLALLEEVRIEVSKNDMLASAKGFNDLIDDIKRYLS